MVLRNLRIERQEKSKLCMDIEYNNRINTLWYEVDNKYEKYLCTELADSFLVALLLFALEKKENITIENVPVSDILLYNIKKYIIPTLCNNITKYNHIEINALTSNIKFNNKCNGTGISRGIDSFCTINEFTNECPDDYKIDYLTFFNIGSHGEYDSEKAYKIFQKRMEKSKKFADEYNFEFLVVNTNISDFIMQEFIETHTFRNMSIIFALQKLFKNYYYSSTYRIEEFKITTDDIAYFDSYTLSLLSTNNVRFYSSGSSINRLEKTKLVANYKPSYKYLNVCFKDDFNCGKCEKCIRTIYELYSSGNLDKYSKVFDINYFYSHRNWYERKFFEFYFKYPGKNSYYKVVYREMKKNNLKIKKVNMIKGLCVFFIKKIYHIFK